MNRRIVALAALPLALAACGPRPPAVTDPIPPPVTEPIACTMEFRTYSVRVETASGVPVTDARIDIRRSDGSTLACTSEGQMGCVNVRESSPSGQPQFYTIMTDGVPVARTGENITVNASSGGKTVVSVFRFAHDGCHVRKLSGPDVLTLGP